MCHVVSPSITESRLRSLLTISTRDRHASISAEKRAERGLPENLIRLCVGIEDPRDLIDDLEHSLIEAGAIYSRFDQSGPSTPTASEPKDIYVSDPETWITERARQFARPGAAGGKKDQVQSLVDDVSTKLGFAGPQGKEGDDKEDILVSAPGKVILFGEHAVVHGVVS